MERHAIQRTCTKQTIAINFIQVHSKIIFGSLLATRMMMIGIYINVILKWTIGYYMFINTYNITSEIPVKNI